MQLLLPQAGLPLRVPHLALDPFDEIALALRQLRWGLKTGSYALVNEFVGWYPVTTLRRLSYGSFREGPKRIAAVPDAALSAGDLMLQILDHSARD